MALSIKLLNLKSEKETVYFKVEEYDDDQLIDAAIKLLEINDFVSYEPPKNWNKKQWNKLQKKELVDRLRISSAFINAEIDRLTI